MNIPKEMFPYVQYMYSYPHKTAYRPLPDIPLSDYLNADTPYSLYIHIPFCESKCGYCNLFSVTGQTEDIMSQYIAALRRQFAQYQALVGHSLALDSLTIGGGTPLLLSCHQLEQLCSFGSQLPIAIETSPRQTTKEKLDVLKQCGVSRVSIGIQSFHAEELLALRRQHTVEECRRALSLLERAGFLCRNLDLIYGIPNQSIFSFRASLQEAVSYEPEELFLYPLYVKQGTSLFEKHTQTSDQAYELYVFASTFLKEHGYHQISMRRFVKNVPDHLITCGFQEMLSLGCGGRSYVKNLHFCTPYHVKPSYCLQQLHHFLKQADVSHISFGYLLNADEMLRRFVIKRLLHADGFSLADYLCAKQQFAVYGYEQFSAASDVFTDFPIIEVFQRDHLVCIQKDNIRLTELGLSYSDWIGPQFISETVAKKMQIWVDDPKQEKGFYV